MARALETASQSVKLIECPRDAWQGLKAQIPTHIKLEYLRSPDQRWIQAY